MGFLEPPALFPRSTVVPSGKVINNISQDLPLFQQINKERLSRGLPALTDQQATKRFNEMMYEYGVVSPHTVGELAVDPASLAAKVAQQVPGEVLKGS